MRPAEIISNIIGGVAVALLGFLCHFVYRTYRKFDRFMTEHLWLLATTLWTRDKVMEIMSLLGIPITDGPPATLMKGKHTNDPGNV